MDNQQHEPKVKTMTNREAINTIENYYKISDCLGNIMELFEDDSLDYMTEQELEQHRKRLVTSFDYDSYYTEEMNEIVCPNHLKSKIVGYDVLNEICDKFKEKN